MQRIPPVFKVHDDRLEHLRVDMQSRHGTSVRLISMSHVALPSFYEQVRQEMEMHGGVVLQEGFHASVLDDRNPVDRAMFALGQNVRMNTALGTALGFDVCRQTDALSYNDMSAVPADLDYRECAQSLFDELGESFFIDLERQNTQLRMFLTFMGIDETRIAWLQERYWNTKVSGFRLKSTLRTHVLREDILLRHVDQQSPDSQLIIPWGAHHIHRIIHQLLERNWSLDEETIQYIPFLKKPVCMLAD